MNFKKLLVCAGLIGVSAFGVGCGDDDVGTTADSGTPPSPCNAAMLASGTSHIYVINVLSLADLEADGTTAGFNVDGDSVVECNGLTAGDTAELNGTAPDNGTGIDNALGPALAGIVGSSIQDGVDSGSVLLMLEVRGVDSFTSDSCVGVNFFIGALPNGVDAPDLDAAGRVAAGQTFDIVSTSFTDGLGGTMPRIQFGSASIVGGRLRGGPADFPLSLSLLGVNLTLTIRSASLRFDITPTTIGIGRLGGALNTEEVVTAVQGIPDLAMYVEIVMDTLNNSADIDENSSPDSCEAGSIALKLDGVTAVRGDVVAPPPPPPPPPPMDGGVRDAGVRTDGGVRADGGARDGA